MRSSESRDDDIVGREVPLAALTWFRVGGPAETLARPRTPEEAADLVARARGEGKAVRVLGAGSNVLVSDKGVRGLVLVLSAEPFKSLARLENEVVHCGAGVKIRRLVNSLADWALAGGEGLSGIPGTVGGALVTNAGTSEGEIGPTAKRVWTLAPDGRPEELEAGGFRFAYRSSTLAGRVVLGAELAFTPSSPETIRARMESLSARRRSSQPEAVRTAGCVFKNPPGTTAGRLLDELGLKGLARGNSRVSPVHANFMEAREGATAGELKALIDECRRRVKDATGIDLELELDLWGFEENESIEP